MRHLDHLQGPQRSDRPIGIMAALAGIDGAISRAIQDKLRDVVSIKDFGGAGDNATPNDLPLSRALSALAVLGSNGARIYFPPGKYKFNASVSYTLPPGLFSVHLMGGGLDNTILTWPNASGGITFNYASLNSSVHVSDLSFTTGVTNGGNALTLNLATSVADPAVTAISDISRVMMRGDDGYAATNYWSTGANVVNVSNIQFDDLTVYGASTPNGIGISLVGLTASSTYGVQYNVAKSTLQKLSTGILYGSFIQGLSVDQTNFTHTVNGIASAGSETGALAQLSVTNSQFNPSSSANGNGILASTEIGMVQIVNNLFLNGGTSQSCVNLARAAHFVISGNEMQGIGGSTCNAIIIGTTVSSAPGVISGNDIFGFGSGGAAIWLQAGSTLVNVVDNVFTGNATNIVNQGTSNRIINNLGYNPVGVSSPAPGASPWTYTAGASPETVYPRASTNVTQIALGGTNLLAANIAANIPATIHLDPGEAVVITYTGTLTMPRFIH